MDKNEIIERFNISKNQGMTALSLLLVAVFMFYLRMQTYSEAMRKRVISGNDGWYHLRQTEYTVRHWPFRMDVDLMSGYPVGAEAGTFGTLFDQLAATVALVIGLGSPSSEVIFFSVNILPVVFSALTVIPVYYLTKSLTDSTESGLVAALLLSLMTGQFLSRGMFGTGDHHTLEAFFMVSSALLWTLAIKQFSSNFIIIETLFEEDSVRATLSKYKKAITYTVLAGISTGLYLTLWPPAIIFIGIVGFAVSLLVLTKYDSLYELEPVLLSVGIGMAVTTVFPVLWLQSFDFGVARFTLLQVAFPLSASLLSIGFILAERKIESSNVSEQLVIGGIFGVLVLAGVVVWIALPDVWELLSLNLRRTLLFGDVETTGTISEAQSLPSRGPIFGVLFNLYGAIAFIAVAGIVSLIFYNLYKLFTTTQKTEFTWALFASVWGLFMFILALNQIRFTYYFSVAAPVFTVVALQKGLSYVDYFEEVYAGQIKSYHVIIGIFIVLLLVPALVYPFQATVVAQANSASVEGSYSDWDNSLDWMSENTPEVDTSYYGPYSDDSVYSDNDYGVMSWWDYGHWITNTGERIPVANPFQQHAEEAAVYLLANSTENAEQSVEQIDDRRTQDSPDVKYIMVDWQMVQSTSKFGAPTVWHPEKDTRDFIEPAFATVGARTQFVGYLHKQSYYEAMMVKLYYYHGSYYKKNPVVVDYEQAETAKLLSENTSVTRFGNMQEAENYVQNNPESQIGGFGRSPREDVSAVKQVRLIKTSDKNALENRRYQMDLQRMIRYADNSVVRGDVIGDASAVKTFERVDGAQVEGSGAPENAEIRLLIQLENPSFIYEQRVQTDNNGNFTTTVPYSTTRSDKYTTENGYTEPETTAQTKYVATYQGNNSSYIAEFDVPEKKVVGDDQEPVKVELTEQSLNVTQETDDS